MAYAALISLEHTIDHLLNSSDIWVDPCYEGTTECKRQVKSLAKVLQRLDRSIKSRSRKKVNALDEQIKEAASRFEDVLEFCLSDQILKQSEEHENIEIVKQDIQSFTELEKTEELMKLLPEEDVKNLVQFASDYEGVLESNLLKQIVFAEQSTRSGNGMRLFIDMQYSKQDIVGFTTRLKKMEKEYIKELKNLLPQTEEDVDEDEDGNGGSGDGGGGGDDDDKEEEEEEEDHISSIFDDGRKSKVVGLSIVMSKLKDQLTSKHVMEFRIRVISVVGMAGIGKTTLANKVFEDPDILDYFDHCVWVTVGIEYQLEKIRQDIRCQVNPEMNIARSLEGKSYLIVLDDVWDTQVLADVKSLLPFRKNGSAILLTTRLQEVCDDPHRSIRVLKMQLLNGEDSWGLLQTGVFGEELCPPILVHAGKKIAENCEGLPLTIVTVARILSRGPMDPEYWNDVAEEKNSVFKDAYDEISKVLFPSYKYLPQHLKPCFLHMGLFHKKYKIPRSKLSNMWMAEGFLEQHKVLTAEEWGVKCLEGLFSNNVAMLYQYSSIESRLGEHIKTCGLHSSFWHLCNREASKSKFFYALNSLVDCSIDGIERQRRLCFRNNILFGIQSHDSIGDERRSSARSLLCYGPYHPYQVPIWFGLRLLRVIDALNIRYYEFPMEVLKLVLLKYFALTFNGDLPTSISRLRKLQYFIVRRHMSIKSYKAPSYLPMEIWDMSELKHLEIMGSDLQVPSRYGTLLPNLQTLLGVSARSCSEDVLGRIPNLHKLGVQIELGLDSNEPLRWFDHISHFRELESLKCVIVNPDFKVVAPPPPLSVFPWGLKRLTLSGFGYPWEDMEAIASFRNLEVLKLQCYAFRGPKWEIKARKFMKLSSLMIEDTDLVQWELRRESLPSLVNLSLKHCYKLKEIHWEHDKYFRPKIEVVDCNPFAVACAEKLCGDAYSAAHVDVHSSYMD